MQHTTNKMLLKNSFSSYFPCQPLWTDLKALTTNNYNTFNYQAAIWNFAGLKELNNNSTQNRTDKISHKWNKTRSIPLGQFPGIISEIITESSLLKFEHLL
jgi:hypothetical protein